MKKLFLLLTFTISLNCFSQVISVATDTYTVPDLVNKVLINSPCVSASNITWKTGNASTNGIGFFQNTNPNFPMKSGVILSTGKATNAVGPNTTELNDGDASWLGDSDLESTLANSGIVMKSANATVLEFDFTPISPNFDFEFLFASEEYGNFQCQFSDAFAFLLTDKTTNITTNLAVVPNTNLPISVVTIRDYLYNSSCTSENAQYFGSYNGGSAGANSPTNFNGQTKLLKASATLSLNTTYHIKLVIADRSDYRSDTGSDSAIFIASDSFNIGQAVLGEDALISNNKALCIGEQYVINSGLDAADYFLSWKKDGVAISGETGSSLTVNAAGIYEITYQKKLNGCIPVSDSVKIEFLPKINTPNPKNLYKCDSGATSYAFDLSINTPIIKTGLDSLTEVSYHISASDADNNINPLPNNFNSNGNQTIYVRVKTPDSPCPLVKNFKLSITPFSVANKPNDLTMCSSSDKASFDLSAQKNAILNGQNAGIYNVSFYSSLADATNDLNIINSSKITAGNTTIYARVQLITDSSCYAITNFNLFVTPAPIVDKIKDVVLCDSYTLPALENGNYFTAAGGKGTPLFAGNVITENQTIYIFNQPGGQQGCSASSSFNVKILDPAELVPQSGTYCGSYKLPPISYAGYFTEADGKGINLKPGASITSSQKIYVYFKSIIAPFCVIDIDFDIKINSTLDIGKHINVFDCTSYTLPSLTAGNYYTESDGQGTKLNAGDVITTTQQIYVYAITSEGCKTQAKYSIIIGMETPTDISQCEPYTLPKLSVGNYYTGPNGTGDIIPGGTSINLTQEIYIYVPTVNAPNCTDNIHFNVAIAQPIIDILSDVTVCEFYALPNLTSGEYFTDKNGNGTQLFPTTKIFDNQKIYIYKKSSTTEGCSNQNSFEVTIIPKPFIDSRSDVDVCNYYILTNLSNGDYFSGTNGTGTKLDAGTKITSSQTIYIFSKSDSSIACTSENSFNITIFPMKADKLNDVYVCDSYTLPALTNGNYYTKTGGSMNGPSYLMHAGDVIKKTTTLYVFAESGERINCTDENSFTITKVVPAVNYISNAPIKVCDEDGTNDGIFDFDLTQLNNSALGSQNPSEYKVEYFSTQNNALIGTNPILSTNLKTAFVRVSHKLAKDCFDIKSINIIVNKLPEPTPKDGIICFDSKTETLLNPYTIQSGLNPANFTFQWSNDDNEIVGTKDSYQAILPGIYTLIATSNATGCSSEPIAVIVSPSEPATITYTVSEDFADNSVITITATGEGGNYEYQLNFGAFQDSPIFDRVDSGIHTITVRDKNGCGVSTTEVLVVKYPKFFTPNGDGYNDTWNIVDLKNKANVIIHIYDRYGKVLTHINPNGQGWDGKNDGKPLPSTDYWFTVNYTEDGQTKEFRSHFSMKR